MPEAVCILRQEHANMAMLLDILDRQLAAAKAKPLAELLSAHEDLALLTRRFARATIDQILHPGEVALRWFTSLGRAFVNVNRRHMAREEEHFFPRVLELLSSDDWRPSTPRSQIGRTRCSAAWSSCGSATFTG